MYTHKDIAFKFASWISSKFKLYVIKNYQCLKQDEAHRLEIGWDTKRELSKIKEITYDKFAKRFEKVMRALELRDIEWLRKDIEK